MLTDHKSTLIPVAFNDVPLRVYKVSKVISNPVIMP